VGLDIYRCACELLMLAGSEYVIQLTAVAVPAFVLYKSCSFVD